MRYLAALAVMVAATVNPWPADAHLAYQPNNDSLEARERTQQRNLHHARYVCERGARANRRWHCGASVWIARELAQTRAILYPKPRPYVAPHPWHSVAMCESSLGTGAPQWHINTGNGFYGGLQFLTSTWLAYGGGRFAPRADQATPAQQVTVASRTSLSHWPICGAAFR